MTGEQKRPKIGPLKYSTAYRLVAITFLVTLSSTSFIHSLRVFLQLITSTSSTLTLNQHHTNILLRHNTLPFC